jgi:hypothetical protein
LRVSRHGPALVADEAVPAIGAGHVISESRDELLSQYGQLETRMVRAGLEPTLSESVIDLFSEGELKVLIKSEAVRLLHYQRLEAER